MSVTVYWSYLGNEWMRATPPQSVRKDLYARGIHEDNRLMNFHKCPFSHYNLENLFSLHSLYDYSFTINGQNLGTNLYDQKFFDDHVTVRSIEKKCFSFFQPFVFFTEEKSLNASFPIFPYMENNNITKRCMTFEGMLDIGKYFRNIDFVFCLKDPYTEFLIERDEIFAYIRFHTDKRVKLQQFYPSDLIKKYSEDINNSKDYRETKFLSPNYYYEKFNMKKLILKEIKNNLID